jgi:hypothetical protein
MMVGGLVLVGMGNRAAASGLGGRVQSARPFVAPPAAGSGPAPAASGGSMSGIQGEFSGAGLGRAITYHHPDRGDRVGRILGTVKYAELWQRRKAPEEPWVPTGNVFTAHWLGDTLLYEWKSGVYLLDGYDQLTDAEIKEHILPHAKAFGESDEKADVNFAYPPASWKVTDIGKFRVDSATGQGLRLGAGAIGRFLHARGNTGYEGRMLVVEDYLEGGGGQDTAWHGWGITWDDIKAVQ